MDIIAIHLARVVAFLELRGLDPSGRISQANGVKMLGERYQFAKIPQRFEDLDFDKGVEFYLGTYEEICIDKLVLFSDGLTIDTRSSTDDCTKVLNDILENARRSSGAAISPSRFMHLSQIIFRSEMKVWSIHNYLSDIGKKIAVSVSSDYNQTVTFEPTMIGISADQSQTKLNPAAFTLDRRAGVPFSEKMYYSAAPLRTSEHIDILNGLEAALM